MKGIILNVKSNVTRDEVNKDNYQIVKSQHCREAAPFECMVQAYMKLLADAHDCGKAIKEGNMCLILSESVTRLTF